MLKGFWKTIKKPVFALAPMADVTDAPFRHIIAKYGKPDVMWTEFVSADGLNSAGREVLLNDLKYGEGERPIVAQFFGSQPENFYVAARLAEELGFDGVDINMGCPVMNVQRQGAGAALINTPELAQEIIREAKRGAGALPVSVKTRIGYNTNTLSEWLPYLLETDLSAIIIHARTRKEMSSVPARWDVVAEAVRMRDAYESGPDRTLILGNGDVASLSEAKERVAQTGADGVMIGRGIFGNPWLFSPHDAPPSLQDKLRVMLEHTRLFEEMFSDPSERTHYLYKNFDVMKKHYKAYVNGFLGAKELRIKLMEARSASGVEEILRGGGWI